MVAKIFTPAEATRTLPLVRRIVADILERGRELRRIQGLATTEPEDLERGRELVAELEEHFAELEQIGCTFRAPNFEYGLVDFPGIIDGQPVHLCWRDDEPELRFYHAPDAGYAGRKPIPADLLTAAD